MSLDYAKIRLAEWGRWSRDPPALRTNFRLWFTGGRGSSEMPQLVEEVDSIIKRMERPIRVVTIVHYCRVGRDVTKAQQVELSLREYRRRLDEGIWFVHTELDAVPTSGVVSVGR